MQQNNIQKEQKLSTFYFRLPIRDLHLKVHVLKMWALTFFDQAIAVKTIKLELFDKLWSICPETNVLTNLDSTFKNNNQTHTLTHTRWINNSHQNGRFVRVTRQAQFHFSLHFCIQSIRFNKKTKSKHFEIVFLSLKKLIFIKITFYKVISRKLDIISFAKGCAWKLRCRSECWQ